MTKTVRRGLTIEYALTRQEIFRFFWRSLAGSPKFQATVILYSVAIGFVSLSFHVLLSRSLTVRDAILAAALAAFMPVFFSLWAFIRAKTDKRSLTISSSGVSTEIGRLKGLVPWEKIREATDTPQFVLIARTNGNAFFVPHRAFSGQEQRDDFLAELNAWLQNSRAPKI
jgi:YcxB-like protein